MRHLIVILLLAFNATAATRYVSTNGTNSGSADSWGNAWRTLTYAEENSTSGDTIYVGAGDYGEYVYISGITNLTWIGVSNATTKAFRIGSPSNTISGMRLIAAQNEGVTWNSFCRIEPAGHWTTITNCYIGDSPQVKATNFTFDATADTIYSPSVDFVAAGFKTNGMIYWGGISMPDYFYANMAKSGTITGVTSNTIYIADGAIDQTETNSSAWSFIFSGPGYDGISAVTWVVSGGNGASNCRFVNNTITNIASAGMLDLGGHSNTISGNRIVRHTGGKLLNIKGSNHQIISNYISDSILPSYYSAYELNNIVSEYHPEGGGFYDFIGGFLHTTTHAMTGNSNNVIAWNWMENVEQPIMQFSSYGYMSEYDGWSVTNNVFIGFMNTGGGGFNNLTISRNTFYRCAFNEGQTYTLSLGSTGTTNYWVENNLFIENGEHSNTNLDGTITFANAYGSINTNGNVRVAPDVLGGLLSFRDPSNPRGADGIPFTEDDGLRPLAHSPLAGKGALAAYTGIAAQFRPINNLGWHESTGSNYNTAWQTSAPYLRATLMRPYTNPPAIGNIPLRSQFEATNSVSGSWSTSRWHGITFFRWEFGDGSRPIITRWPDITHTFLRTGIVSVALTVTNTLGATATTRRLYNVLPVSTYTNTIWHVATTGNNTNSGTVDAPLLTISNAITKVSAGDYIAVLPGHYDELPNASTQVAGTSTKPIVLVGYNARCYGFVHRKNCWELEGMEFVPTNNPSGWCVYIFATVSDITMRNNWWHDNSPEIVAVKSVASSDLGATNVALYANVVERMDGDSGAQMLSFTGNNGLTFENNIVRDTTRQGDGISFDAHNVTIKRNYFYNLGSDNHPDFFQINGFNQVPKFNIRIEQNWCEMPTNTLWDTQISDMTSSTNGSALYTNMWFINNVFINAPKGGSAHLDGIRVYNNLYYQCGAKSNSSAMVFNSGGVNGSCYGMDIKNNIWLRGGPNLGASWEHGWYANGDLTVFPHMTNVTLTADYNYVAGLTNAAKRTAPPDGGYRWGSYGFEAHGINGGDAGFNNEANFDFRLRADSVLVDGVPLNDVTVDFFGDTRVYPTIGPFQFADYSGNPPPDPEPEPQPSGGATLHGRAGLRGRAALK